MEVSNLVALFGMLRDPLKSVRYERQDEHKTVCKSLNKRAKRGVDGKESCISGPMRRVLDCMIPSCSAIYPSVVKAMDFDFEMGSATCYDSVISTLGFELQPPYKVRSNVALVVLTWSEFV